MEQKIKQASLAHERVMFNLAAFHLLLPVAALSSGYLMQLLTVSVAGAVFMLAWIFWHCRHIAEQGEWVVSHWQVAWNRCKLLMLAYVVSLSIMLIGYWIGSMQADSKMASIMLVVFSRIAAVPTVLMVLALLVMETTALSNARQGKAAN